MNDKNKWLTLCDLSCEQRKDFPNCCNCDIALEYRQHNEEKEIENND